MAHDIRETLKPFNRKRIQVRGVLGGFGPWTRHSTHRTSLRACIEDPEVDGTVIGHHVWVTDCKHWENCKDRVGQHVVFNAVVTSYVDREKKTNYCLTNADEPKFPHLPALSIPSAPRTNGVDVAKLLVEEEIVLPNNEPAPSAERPDPVAAMKLAKRFIKTCGSEDAARSAARFIVTNPSMNLEDTLTWIDALSENVG